MTSFGPRTLLYKLLETFSSKSNCANEDKKKDLTLIGKAVSSTVVKKTIMNTTSSWTLRMPRLFL